MLRNKRRIFHVAVRGKPIPVPGGVDIDSLLAIYFCGMDGPGMFYIGEVRSKNGVAVHPKASRGNYLIPRGKLVTIRYERNQRTAPPLDKKRLIADLEAKEKEAEARYVPVDIAPEPPGLRRLRVFNLSVRGKKRRIAANLQRHGQFGVLVYWADGICTLTVSGADKEHLKTKLRPGEQISIALGNLPPKRQRCSPREKFE
jgi:hypothetical protein